MQEIFNDYGVYMIIGLLMVLLIVFYFVNRTKAGVDKQEKDKPEVSTKKDDVAVKVADKPSAAKVEPKKEQAATPKAAPKVKPVEETSSEEDDPSKDVVSKDKPARYHVSQNKDDKSQFFKKWRVRKEGSSKTIKYYDTQKEAIEVAEDLADKAGTTIVIHKMDGKIRKQDYSKK